MTPRARIFDHLDAIPLAPPPADEEAHFIRVAKAMRSSTWWRTIPDASEPRCAACGCRQFRVGKHGDMCVNGHGGAPSLERWP
ncbi:MAG TPA: hypothetical protein VFO62_10620 [Candidatus Binatia bacterium]|nr:hypothetical protein [Candidatus Binatia bacterium]